MCYSEMDKRNAELSVKNFTNVVLQLNTPGVHFAHNISKGSLTSLRFTCVKKTWKPELQVKKITSPKEIYLYTAHNIKLVLFMDEISNLGPNCRFRYLSVSLVG